MKTNYKTRTRRGDAAARKYTHRRRQHRRSRCSSRVASSHFFFFIYLLVLFWQIFIFMVHKIIITSFFFYFLSSKMLPRFDAGWARLFISRSLVLCVAPWFWHWVSRGPPVRVCENAIDMWKSFHSFVRCFISQKCVSQAAESFWYLAFWFWFFRLMLNGWWCQMLMANETRW